MDLNVGGLALGAAGHLMDHDLGVGQRLALALGARRQQESAHGGRHADANGGHVALQVLHGIVDGHAGVHRAARTVDIEHDIRVRVLHFQEQHLRHDQVGRIIGNLAAQEDDPVLQ